MSDANTRHMRAGRARIRGAMTMLRQAVNLLRMSTGIESMPPKAQDSLTRIARALEGTVSDLKWSTGDLDIAEELANKHLAMWRANPSRRRR